MLVADVGATQAGHSHGRQGRRAVGEEEIASLRGYWILRRYLMLNMLITKLMRTVWVPRATSVLPMIM